MGAVFEMHSGYPGGRTRDAFAPEAPTPNQKKKPPNYLKPVEPVYGDTAHSERGQHLAEITALYSHISVPVSCQYMQRSRDRDFDVRERTSQKDILMSRDLGEPGSIIN